MKVLRTDEKEYRNFEVVYACFDGDGDYHITDNITVELDIHDIRYYYRDDITERDFYDDLFKIIPPVKDAYKITISEVFSLDNKCYKITWYKDHNGLTRCKNTIYKAD